jgi:hypothetical protein
VIKSPYRKQRDRYGEKQMANTAMKTEPKGYKSHKPGSRKGKVHALYDRQGPDAAWTLGLKLKLKEGTLRSWFGSWGKSKPVPKKKSQKAADSASAAA